MMQRKRGFTLIELMIVVAIIAILAVIAVPWWGRYMYRARRADAQNMLTHIAQMEERYYTDNNSYTQTLTNLGYTTPVLSENGYYTATLAVNPASAASQGYIATATPTLGGPQVGDACGALSIDNTGQKLPAPANVAANSNGLCW